MRSKWKILLVKPNKVTGMYKRQVAETGAHAFAGNKPEVNWIYLSTDASQIA